MQDYTAVKMEIKMFKGPKRVHSQQLTTPWAIFRNQKIKCNSFCFGVPGKNYEDHYSVAASYIDFKPRFQMLKNRHRGGSHLNGLKCS